MSITRTSSNNQETVYHNDNGYNYNLDDVRDVVSKEIKKGSKFVLSDGNLSEFYFYSRFRIDQMAKNLAPRKYSKYVFPYGNNYKLTIHHWEQEGVNDVVSSALKSYLLPDGINVYEFTKISNTQFNKLSKKAVCANCYINPEHPSKCICGDVYYCDKTCQKKHWKNHKNTCSTRQ